MLTRFTAATGVLVSLAVAVLLATPRPAGAGSEFTYQGQLRFGDQPVNSTCSFDFSLWSASFGGTQQGPTLTRSGVTVTNGLFTVQLDFGGAALAAGIPWLQTGVGCTGLAPTILNRQRLTAAPYAYSADTVVAGGVGSSQLADDAVTSAKIASGAVTATEIGSSAVTSAKIAAGAVTAAAIATDAVTSAEIASGAVGTAEMATGAVTSTKIQDGTITDSDVDTSSIQRRISGGCAMNSAVTNINEDGTIACIPVGGLALPYAESLSDSDPLLSLTNTGSGIGVRGGSDSGRGVLGQSGSNTGVSGLSTSATGVEGVSTSGVGVWGRTGGASGSYPLIAPGVYGNAESSPGVFGASLSAAGVLGQSTSGAGVGGVSTSGHGVTGASSSGNGVYGLSAASAVANAGVVGENTAADGNGVKGIANNGTSAYGVFGDSLNGRGVYGNSTNGYGVYGATGAEKQDGEDYAKAAVTGDSSASGGVGVRGIASSDGAGVVGSATGSLGYGVMGNNPAGGGVIGTGALGVMGLSETRTGVYGWTNSASSVEAGVFGEAPAAGGTAMRAVANNGASAWAIVAESTSGYAGYFKGKVYVKDGLQIGGTLSKGGGSFKIDHPLDPANKYLSHSFVESPDMKNIYDGVVTLDDAGEALVTLPAWFEALNRDFRYQLTCVGGFAPVYIDEEIEGNQFRIAGGAPGLKVSWQVTGIRQDAFANAHPIVVEEEKPADEQGLYLHPVEHGQPESLSLAQSMEAKK